MYDNRMNVIMNRQNASSICFEKILVKEVYAFYFSTRWKLISQKILQTSANVTFLKMRFNKQELLTLATQPSQKFEKEGILYVRERQEGFFRRTESEFITVI